MGYYSEAIIDNGDEYERCYGSDDDYDDDYNDIGIDYNVERGIRKRNLIGKYVVICDNRHSGGIRYLQDQSISTTFKGHYWTDYIENAKPYTDLTAALVRCKNLKYNNPRVVVVGKNYELISWRNW